MRHREVQGRPVQLLLRREEVPDWLVRICESGHRAVEWYEQPPNRPLIPMPRGRHRAA